MTRSDATHDTQAGSEHAKAGSNTVRPHASALLIAAVVIATSGSLLAAAGVAPSILTGHQNSMTNYESLREHVGSEGPSDIIGIGPSVLRRGLVPAVVSAELSTALSAGREPRVYNFAAPGHSLLAYPVLVSLALRVDDPQLFVLMVTPRSIDDTVAHYREWTETVLASPYGLATEDPLAWRGAFRLFLLDHVSLLSVAPTLRSLAQQGRTGL